MRVVTLQGETKKGRERVKQHGPQWVVEGVVGGRLFLKALKGFPGGDWRWVWLDGDQDFTVVKDEEIV